MVEDPDLDGQPRVQEMKVLVPEESHLEIKALDQKFGKHGEWQPKQLYESLMSEEDQEAYATLPQRALTAPTEPTADRAEEDVFQQEFDFKTKYGVDSPTSRLSDSSRRSSRSPIWTTLASSGPASSRT